MGKASQSSFPLNHSAVQSVGVVSARSVGPTLNFISTDASRAGAERSPVSKSRTGVGTQTRAGGTSDGSRLVSPMAIIDTRREEDGGQRKPLRASTLGVVHESGTAAGLRDERLQPCHGLLRPTVLFSPPHQPPGSGGVGVGCPYPLVHRRSQLSGPSLVVADFPAPPTRPGHATATDAVPETGGCHTLMPVSIVDATTSSLNSLGSWAHGTLAWSFPAGRIKATCRAARRRESGATTPALLARSGDNIRS